MSRNHPTRFVSRNVAIVACLFALGGCLSEGNSDEPELTPPATTDITDHELTGSVGDGPVVGASITVMTKAGDELGAVSSTTTAEYDITVKTRGSDYPLRVVAIGGTDLVTEAQPDFTMRSMVTRPGRKTVANINPFTALAYEVAVDLPGGVTDTNVLQALDIVGTEINVGLSSMRGAGVMTSAVDGANIAEVLRASEALGEVVRRVRDNLQSAGLGVTGDGVVVALGSDLADGILDGRGGPRTDPRISALAGVTLAQVSLETMQNRLRVQGSDALTRITAAMGQVFQDTPSPSLAELPLTPEMLQSARIGVLAANTLQPSGEFSTLLAEVDGLSAGLMPGTVQQLLSGDASSSFVAVRASLAAGSDAEIETVNQVLRSGSAPSQNAAPVISGTPPGSVDTGALYSFRPTASDADGDPLTFTVSGLPSWASFSSATGELSGVPAAGDAGSYPGIGISVTDGEATVSLPAFTITVSAVAGNSPPTISGNPPASVTVGAEYDFQPTAADADGDALAFTIVNRPTWASFNAGTGRLRGTPQSGDAGDWTDIRISVSDGMDSVPLSPFTISVQASAPVNTPPVIGGNPPASVVAGSAYTFTPQASDADGDALSFSISGQPSWATFDSSNGRLSGTPGDGDVGSWSGISITVSDGTDSDSLGPFSITVEAVPVNTPPVIGGNPPATVVARSAYDFTPQASDDDGDTLSFSISGQPSWASFDSSNGRLSGTPGDGDVGSYSGISISVSDGQDSATLGPFSITVEAIVLGSATLSWTPPTENTDGTPLTDLVAYRIRWGTSSGDYTQSVRIDNPGLSSYVIDNLAPGTWYFVSTAINSDDVESGYSNEASKTIQP